MEVLQTNFCRIHPMFRDKDEGGNILCQVAGRPLSESYSQATHEYQEGIVMMNEQKLRAENHSDLVIMESVDVYRNLPKKLKAAYTFVHRHLASHNNTDWILKVDDEMFVRPEKLRQFLVNETAKGHLDPSTPTLLGKVYNNLKASKTGKWKEVPQYPQNIVYPSFSLGSAGHIVSRPIVDYIAKFQDSLFDYQGEDASVGIWIAAGKHTGLPGPPTNSSNHTLGVASFVKLPSMSNDGKCTDESVFVLGHDLSDKGLQQCQAYWDGSINFTNQKLQTVPPVKVHPSVYICGWEMFPNGALFPDLDDKGFWTPQMATRHDILVYGMGGPCKVQNPKLLPQIFQGKVIIWYPEPYGGSPPSRRPKLSQHLCQIGPYVDTANRHSLSLLQLAVYRARNFYLPSPSEFWQYLVDPLQRQINTENFKAILYISTTCVPSHQAAAKTLSQIVPVHHGNCLVEGNNTEPIPSFHDLQHGNVSTDFRIFHDYKYCLVMEKIQMQNY